MIAYLFFGTVVASFACISCFFLKFIWGGGKYAEKGSKEYESLTIGNPLNAFFISRILTHDGLVLRGALIKCLVGLWVAFLIVALLIVNTWPNR
jgi:hypothetical protein